MELRNIKLENLSKISYDCLTQQLLILSQYYCGEYWKVFLESQIVVNEKYIHSIKENKPLIFRKNYFDSIHNYYGISITETRGGITFTEEHEVYLAAMKAEDYPLFVSSFTNHLDHFFIIYGEIEGHYIINDNYYDISEYIVEKEIIDKNLVKIYRVMKDYPKVNENQVDLAVNKKVKEFVSDSWNELCKHTLDYNVTNLLDSIKKISEYIDGTSKILEGYFTDNLYGRECGAILLELSAKINTVFYSVLKEYIKKDVVENSFSVKKMNLLSTYLETETIIKKEVFNIICGENSLYDVIKKQIEEFLECEITENEKLYEAGIEQYSLIALLSYLEIENNLEDIDVMMFTTEYTFNEVIMKVCKYILVQKIEKIS